MANGDDPVADATSTANPDVLPAESTANPAVEDSPAANIVLEYRDTPGPLTKDALIALDAPLPTSIYVEGRAFSFSGFTNEATPRPIYASV